MIEEISKVPEGMKAAREALGISTNELARLIHLRGKHAGHTVRRWEAGEAPIPAYVWILLDLALKIPGVLAHLKQNKWTGDDQIDQ
jgi:DNA-binding transcriptional regulator YiaG